MGSTIDGMQSFAVFSGCGRYRYSLSRKWNEGPTINFLMLNPSTADENRNDPTVERCMRRAISLGFGRMVVTNIFAFRSTDPHRMREAADPVGPLNLKTIVAWAKNSDRVVCAWGVHGNHLGQGEKVLSELRKYAGGKLFALRLTKDGVPGHPLYLPYDCGLIEI